MDAIQRIENELADIDNRCALCQGILNEMVPPQVQQQKQQRKQEQVHDIQRNYLVIQTLRTEIAFLISKHNLLEYDKEQITKRQRKNAGGGAGNAGGGAGYAGGGAGNAGGGAGYAGGGAGNAGAGAGYAGGD